MSPILYFFINLQFFLDFIVLIVLCIDYVITAQTVNSVRMHYKCFI